MVSFLFYIDGLDREVWQDGLNELDAKEKLWDSFEGYEKDQVVIFDCIDKEIL